MNKLLTNTVFVTLAALLCCALWGSATPFIKIGCALALPMRDVPSTILFAGLRFTLAGVITVLMYSAALRRLLLPKRESLGSVAVISLFQTVVQYIFFYIGLANTSGVKGTVASGSNAFFAILIASLVFKQERLTARKVLACIVGFAGVVLINLKGLDFSMNFLGDGFVILSSCAYGVSSALIKKYSEKEDPVVLSGYQFALGGAVMAIAGAAFGGRVDITGPAAAGVLVYLAFLSAIAYSLWGVLLKHNPVSRVTVFAFMIPVFGVLLSKLMLEEASGVGAWNLVITLTLICIGILMLNLKKEKNKG